MKPFGVFTNLAVSLLLCAGAAHFDLAHAQGVTLQSHQNDPAAQAIFQACQADADSYFQAAGGDANAAQIVNGFVSSQLSRDLISDSQALQSQYKFHEDMLARESGPGANPVGAPAHRTGMCIAREAMRWRAAQDSAPARPPAPQVFQRNSGATAQAPKSVDANAQTAVNDVLQAQRNQPADEENNGISPKWRPVDRQIKQAFDAEAKRRQKRVHHAANDMTQCLKVEATGAREEWGMAGRFRIKNTCGSAVRASWCANEMECSSGHGNLWTIPAGSDWPIFFADPNNPFIRVGGCKVASESVPLPSDAALARAGGLYSRHSEPPSAPGVGSMPGHSCE